MRNCIIPLRLCDSHGFDFPLPRYHTRGSSGMDLLSALPHTLKLGPLERVCVPTGIEIELPPGIEAQIRPRSGLALKHGITVLNSPGTIDSDYRGEIKVLLINLGEQSALIHRGDRIAQIVFSPVVAAQWVVVDQLEPTQRGEGGFGHTGGECYGIK